MPLSPGETLDNRYRVVKLLGEGGFGAVYRVWDIRLEYPRALKENLDTSPEAQRQFKREAQILTALSHPNLPKVIDHFVIPDQGQYLVMDYVEGQDLQEMLKRAGRPLPEAQVTGWIEQVCEALSYLHSQNPPVIHRDIKPANIRITPDGHVQLVDFGLAKFYDPKLSTTVGARAVTPGYTPFEQYGMELTDARTDIYALGATLYHLLTDEIPLESVARVSGRHLVAPRDLNPAISATLESVLIKALEVMPENRFQDVRSFLNALRSVTHSAQPTWVSAAQPMTATVPVSGAIASENLPPAPGQSSSLAIDGTAIPTSSAVEASTPVNKSTLSMSAEFSGESLSLLDTWIRALTKPSVSTYEQIASDPMASSRRAYKWIFVSSLIGSIISALLGSLFGVGTFGVTSESNKLFSELCGVLMGSVFPLLGIIICARVTQRVANALGGKGAYVKLVYSFAAFIAPLILISSFLSIIPYIECLNPLLGIYGIVLGVIAVKAVNQFSWGNAIGSSATIIIILFVLIAISVFVILPSFGLAIESLFSLITQGFEFTGP